MSSGFSVLVGLLFLFSVLVCLVTFFLHLLCLSSLEFRDNSLEELDTEGLKITLYPAVRSADVKFSLDAPDAS